MWTYDDAGNITSRKEYAYTTGSMASTLGAHNPLRYRGYVYDNDTELYYLQSRYYDPQVGRFINSDALVSTGQGVLGNNMFAYCGNNPINRTDPTGALWRELIAIAIGIGCYIYDYVKITEENYQHNSAVDSNPETTTQNRILNDQNGATGKNFKYGIFDASHGVCEAIAVHNAKVLLGMDSSLSNTIRDCQESWQMLLLGVLGTNPWSIDVVLNRSGISSTRVGLNEMTNPGVYIISYWHSSGAHTVAVLFDGSTYTTYNLYGNGIEYYYHPTEYAGNYIAGYYLGGIK